jgi:putative heme-binding domain-containing protein
MPARTLARTLAAAAGFAVLSLALLADRHTRADEPKEQPKRKPWTTSKITGSPEPPPPFKSVRVFPEVKFNHPLLIARCPGTDRLFVGEQEGTIYSVKPGAGATKDVFLDLKKDYKSLVPNPGAKGIGELYGLVFHPKFEENRYCYVCYTLAGKAPKDGRFPDGSRVSRFSVTKTEPPRIDPTSEEVILTFVGGGHNGGDLHFGPDGMLYISTGDAASPNPPDAITTGQDCSDLLSSVLRIDVNTRDAGKNYAVPKDNPFVGMKDVRPEIWAFGFRNPWRMSFDRQTGELWLGDVGWELWEMVHKIEKGGNYGWSIMEGPQPIRPNQKIGPTPIRPPMVALPHTIACSVTGGYVYRGKKLPELVGAYVFGDWETRRVWAARFENGRVREMPEIVKPNVRMSAFGEDNAGELYFAEYDSGVLYTLERNDVGGANTNFPKKLSDTGLFTQLRGTGGFQNVVNYGLADGVIRFRPVASQWQDGADAEYFLALPGLSSVKLFEKPRPLPGQVFWHNFSMQFPKDAVLVKTISLGNIVGRDGLHRRRVETQILHFDGEDWHPYAYAWRDDQSDADLVPAEGGEKVFTVAAKVVVDRFDGHAAEKREQVWTFHSRNQCMQCHNSWSEYALAFSPAQLNCRYGEAPHGDRNQLVSLTQGGFVQRVGANDDPLPAFDTTAAEKQPALAPPFGRGGSLDARARSYLHANCAHCHRFGGGGGQVVLELDYSKSLTETGILDVKPKQGDFGLPDARIVAPGDPYRSVLFYRMAKFGRGRMPHLGSEWPHHDGLDLMAQWISSLSSPPKKWSIPREPDAKSETALNSFADAWPYARRFEDLVPWGEEAGSRRLLDRVSRLELGPVRDLFEGYLPPDPKGRKLGSNPRPTSILSLTGDAKKGEAIFANKEMKCINCHKVGDKGVPLGPDLTAIGKTRTRAELLESLLQPSARVEPQFAAYLVRTKDEKTVTGLLVKRDEKQVIVRDAENKEHTFPAAEVESVTPSRLSLMPDGQMAGLTPQEAADLLEFLATRK